MFAIRSQMNRLSTVPEEDESEDLFCSLHSPEGDRYKILMKEHPDKEDLYMVIAEKEDGSVNIEGWLTSEKAHKECKKWQEVIKKGGSALKWLFAADE